MINRRLVPALLALAAAFPFSRASAQCWYPDQKTEAPDVPCNSDGSASACCNADTWCLDNGLCYGNGVVSRGSCTDQSWNDPACAQVCATENTNAGIPISPCNPLESTFVCGSGSDDCSNNVGVFTMASSVAGNNLVLRASQVSGESTAMTIAPTSTITASGDETSNDGSGSGSSNSSGSTTTVTATPSGSSGSSSGATFTAGDMAGVGAGVGVPLLLALLGAFFVIYRQRKRMNADTNKSVDPPHEHNGAYLPAPAYQAPPPSHEQPVYAHFAHLPPAARPQEVQQVGATQYQPMSPGQQQGQFTEMTPVSEMDAGRNRSELPSEGK